MKSSAKTPKYQQIADQIRQQIQRGELKQGDRLPSITEMAALHGISLHTIEKVHGILEVDGLIRRERGRGIFVDDTRSNPQTGFLAYLSMDYSLTQNLLYYATLQQGMRQATHEAGKYLTIVEDPWEFPHWNLMEGLLLTDLGAYDRKKLKALLPKDLPCLNLLYNDPAFNSVIADDAGGMRQAMEVLIGLGHRRIGYLSHLKHEIMQERYRSYLATLKAHDIEANPDWVYNKVQQNFPNYREYGYQAMKQWLSDGWANLGLTAVLAHNDLAAVGMIKALAEHGVRVPEDISVVGFDGIVEHGMSPVDIATVKIPLEEIGQTAIKVLLDQQQNQNNQRITVQLPAQFQPGSTIRDIT